MLARSQWPGTLCSVLQSRTRLGHVAVAELKRKASLSAVKWRNVKVNPCNLASCGCSGSGVTVPYRNGLLEPMHRTGSGYAPMQRPAQSIKPTKQVAVLRHVHAASQKWGQTSASPTARPTMRHQLMLGQVREWQCRPNGKARPATY